MILSRYARLAASLRSIFAISAKEGIDTPSRRSSLSVCSCMDGGMSRSKGTSRPSYAGCEGV